MLTDGVAEDSLISLFFFPFALVCIFLAFIFPKRLKNVENALASREIDENERTEAQAKIEATKKYTKLGIPAWIVSMIIFIIVIATGVFTIERNSKCTICKEPATKTFQSSPYCEEHYIEAVKWAFNNVAGN